MILSRGVCMCLGPSEVTYWVLWCFHIASCPGSLTAVCSPIVADQALLSS